MKFREMYPNFTDFADDVGKKLVDKFIVPYTGSGEEPPLAADTYGAIMVSPLATAFEFGDSIAVTKGINLAFKEMYNQLFLNYGEFTLRYNEREWKNYMVLQLKESMTILWQKMSTLYVSFTMNLNSSGWKNKSTSPPLEDTFTNFASVDASNRNSNTNQTNSGNSSSASAEASQFSNSTDFNGEFDGINEKMFTDNNNQNTSESNSTSTMTRQSKLQMLMMFDAISISQYTMEFVRSFKHLFSSMSGIVDQTIMGDPWLTLIM